MFWVFLGLLGQEALAHTRSTLTDSLGFYYGLYVSLYDLRGAG